MPQQQVVLDSSNLDAILADAGVKVEKPEEKKVEAEVKPEPKKEIKEDEDEEAPDFATRLGITKEQHEEMTRIFKRNIGREHRRMKEAEAFAAQIYNEKRLAEAELDKLREQLQTPKKEPEGPVEPRREDFADEGAYFNAMVDYRADLRIAEREKRMAEEREKEKFEQVKAAAAERVSKARELVPDFDEVMQSLGDDDRIPDSVGVYMTQSELMPELAYYLATHKEELHSLQKMTPHAQLVAIGKIEAKLEPFAKRETSSDGGTPKQTAPEPIPKPRVEAPITPIREGTGTVVEKPLDAMSYHEARRHYEKTKGANLSRRQRH